jgi:hypothetical protein
VRNVDPAAGLAFAADGATVAAGAFNAAWLFRYRPFAGPPRSFAALTLAVLNAGIALQAAFGQALYAGHRWGFETEPFFDTGPWLASRALVLAGTLALSLLILRKAAR